MQKFNIWYKNVPDDASDKYLEQLQAAGFESQLTSMGPQGGMLSAQKGKVAVQFMHGKQDKTGVLIAYDFTEE
jgi:hypothetical protein